mmetsp:Transcript_39706/g.98174  ORF Transcript_39706/g.98174 Transcript_39706/m.98174 type:complete len:80 (+) Transcript_39706:357-596(+)
MSEGQLRQGHVAGRAARATLNVKASRDELAARRQLDSARARAGTFGRDAGPILFITRDLDTPAASKIAEFVRSVRYNRE